MTYSQALTKLTDGLCYGPVSARGLLLTARVRGQYTDAGTTIICNRHPTDATLDRFKITRALEQVIRHAAN